MIIITNAHILTMSDIGEIENGYIITDNGKIAENGTHTQLMEKNGLYAEMYRLQHMSNTLKISEGAKE